MRIQNLLIILVLIDIVTFLYVLRKIYTIGLKIAKDDQINGEQKLIELKSNKNKFLLSGILLLIGEVLFFIIDKDNFIIVNILLIQIYLLQGNITIKEAYVGGIKKWI